jgi:predicted TPR repeat methyltransferase
MTIFDSKYAELYNAFNKEKDYLGEFSFLFEIIETKLKKNLQFAKALEIGCGSGNYTKFLNSKVENLLAVDISQEMINEAIKLDLDSTQFACVTLEELRSKNMHFDLIISLFHVFSYFTTEDIENFIQLCEQSLSTGGFLVFDFWDLPTVKKTPPRETKRVIEVDNRMIERRATAVTSLEPKIVEVCFSFFDLHADDESEIFREKHQMHVHDLKKILTFFPNYKFHGSFDLVAKSSFNGDHYGNLVIFEKIAG